MIQDYEITAWLGDAADQLTADQLTEFAAAVRDWHRQHPDADAAWVEALEALS